MVRMIVGMEVTRGIPVPKKLVPTSNSHAKDLDIASHNHGCAMVIMIALTIQMKTDAHRLLVLHHSSNAEI
jgi:hypothetical protein